MRVVFGLMFCSYHNRIGGTGMLCTTQKHFFEEIAEEKIKMVGWGWQEDAVDEEKQKLISRNLSPEYRDDVIMLSITPMAASEAFLEFLSVSVVTAVTRAAPRVRLRFAPKPDKEP